MRYFWNLAPLVVVVSALNLGLDDRTALRVLVLTLIWAVGGLAWNLTAKAGLISLGHAAFTGIGAYTFVLLLENFDINPWLGMLASMVLAAVAAAVIGIPTFRLQGFYFTLATMAYPLILMLLVINAGLPEVTVPFHPEAPALYMQWHDPSAFVWLLLVLLVLTLAFTLWVDGGRFGQALRSVRDNEVLARSIGIRSDRWKLASLVVSAAISAAVGVIWVNAVLLVISAEEVFGIGVVILMLSVTFVGGIGRTWGPVLGAVILIPLGQVLTIEVGDRIPGAESLVYGLALVAAAILAPLGLIRYVDQIAARIPWLHGRSRPVPYGAAPSESPAVPHREAVESDEPLLVVDHVGRSFGGLAVLTDVSFAIEKGARVGVIGPNGAGKTTLFNILSGHLKQGSGALRLLGQDISPLNAPSRFRLGVSRTFQHPQGFQRMTAHENVAVAAMGSGVVRDADSAATEVLRRVGLADKQAANLTALTAYELKLLELARALVAEPRLLLVDEPLAGLNEHERNAYFATFDEAVPSDTGVLVIEHSVRSLIQHVDTIIALDGGQVIAHGEPGVVVKDPRIIEAYLGSKWNTQAVPSGG